MDACSKREGLIIHVNRKWCYSIDRTRNEIHSKLKTGEKISKLGTGEKTLKPKGFRLIGLDINVRNANSINKTRKEDNRTINIKSE